MHWLRDELDVVEEKHIEVGGSEPFEGAHDRAAERGGCIVEALFIQAVSSALGHLLVKYVLDSIWLLLCVSLGKETLMDTHESIGRTRELGFKSSKDGAQDNLGLTIVCRSVNRCYAVAGWPTQRALRLIRRDMIDERDTPKRKTNSSEWLARVDLIFSLVLSR